MKRIIILFGVLLCIYSLHSQSYTPFPDSNAVWKSSEVPYPPPPVIWYAAHWDYIPMGDTIINNMTYKKVGRIDYNVQCSQIFTGPYYYSAIREDTVERKVYRWFDDNSEEFLLYDFSLEIGDTVNTPINMGDGYIVGAIDSILVGDSYRKRFFYEKEFATPIEVIEGIGAFTGLFEPMIIFDHVWWLRCYYQDGEALYLNPYVAQCDLEIDTCLPVNIHEMQVGSISLIYPNPFTTSTTIEYKLTEPSYCHYMLRIMTYLSFIC